MTNAMTTTAGPAAQPRGVASANSVDWCPGCDRPGGNVLVQMKEGGTYWMHPQCYLKMAVRMNEREATERHRRVARRARRWRRLIRFFTSS